MIKEEKDKKDENFSDLQKMMEAGLHFGHKSSAVHPKMKPYLYGVRNTIHIIDLEKTATELKKALEFIQKLILEDKVMLLVGTKVQARDLVKKTAEECGIPYVNGRWLGGTITNFPVIKERIEYFKELERKRREGDLDKYTKKERADFDREIEKLETNLGGIKNLGQLPDAVFITDARKDKLAIREAKSKGIKVIGIADSNVDPGVADYPIPANDDAISSLSYILGKVKEAIVEARGKKPEPEKEKS